MTHTSAPPALGESISSRSRRPFWSDPKQALELGPLRDKEQSLPPELVEQLRTLTPKGVPVEMVETLAAYYLANRPEDSDWVVLPVANFDAYFGTTSFGRKYLKQIPETILERSETGFGQCRYRLSDPLAIKQG